MHRQLTRRVAVAAACLLPLAAMSLPSHSVAAHSSAAHVRKSLRVGIVLDVGGIDDKGFNHMAYLGGLAAQKKYGATFKYVQTTTSSDALYYANLSTFARQGYDLVFGIGFLMQPSMYKVAKAYPNIHFGLVDGAPTDAKGNTVNLPNVANLFFREQESGYLVGYMAGLMEKNKVGAATHNVIGAMGGLSIPPVNRYIAGYYQGARTADPSIKVLLGYSNSFTDQSVSLNLGLHQASKNADILFAVAGAAGLGYLKAAQEKNVYGIGVDSDQAYLGPYMMTSAVKKVDQAVLETIGNLASGKFKGGNNSFNLSNGATGYGTVGKMVPQSIVDQVKAQAKLVASGKIVPTTVIPKQ
ncbi:MAG TPA: BMP family ABC transporter substrate-binding protein [Chloroflexota bacterium]|jgi:basic membrane protein A